MGKREKEDPSSFCEILEDEYERLHGALPSSQFWTEAGRLAELYALVHALPEKRAALCLSGGGFGSVGFALGITQAFARHNLLEKFHYLSTVSDGSYLGGWLTACIHRHPKGVTGVVEELSRPPQGESESEPVRRLRAKSISLNSRQSASFGESLSLVVIFARKSILKWLMLLMLVATVLMLPRVYIKLMLSHPSALITSSVFTTGILAALLALINSQRGAQTKSAFKTTLRFGGNRLWMVHWWLARPLVAAMLLATWWSWTSFDQSPGILRVAIGAGLLYPFSWLVNTILLRRFRIDELLSVSMAGAAGGILYALVLTRLLPDIYASRNNFLVYVCIAVPLLMTVFVVAESLRRAIAPNPETDEDSGWGIQSDAWVMLGIVSWVTVNVLVIFAPYYFFSLGQEPRALVLSVGFLLGVVVSITADDKGLHSTGHTEGRWSYLRSDVRTAAQIGFMLFLIGLASWLTTECVVFAEVWTFLDLKFDDHIAVLLSSSFPAILMALVVFLAGVLLTSLLVNIDDRSLFSIRRSRLARTYLDACNGERTPKSFDSTVKNSILMGDLGRQTKGKLFHVINLAMAYTRRRGRALREQSVQPFSITPVYAGSYGVGYRSSTEYGGGRGVSLGAAVTLSSADDRPGTDLRWSPSVKALRRLFNIDLDARLGSWFGNPGTAGKRTFHKPTPPLSARLLIREALGFSNKSAPYVYLTGGGQFDNLGLFEMVLRRCHFIVVSDSSHDPGCKFESLSDIIRKIRSELGVPIDFDEIAIYSREAKKMGKYYALGRIGYSVVDGPGTDGVLVYLKPAFYGDEPIDVTSYARSNGDFPHESDVVRDSGESQFESYRRLGAYIVQRAIGKGVVDSFEDFVRQIRYDLSQRPVTETEHNVTRQIESVLRGPILDNYRGFVCAQFTNPKEKDKDRDLKLTEEGSTLVHRGEKYLMDVWLQGRSPEIGLHRPVEIHDGQNVKEVFFEIVPDSETLEFHPKRNFLPVREGDISPHLKFEFAISKKPRSVELGMYDSSSPPEQPARHRVWVQVFQKNRLIQTMVATLEVIEG